MDTAVLHRSRREIHSTHGTAASRADRRATTPAPQRGAGAQSSRPAQAPGPDDLPTQLSPAELEFMQAMQAYKQTSGRSFPTWSEVLEVLRSLGYQKPPQPASR